MFFNGDAQLLPRLRSSVTLTLRERYRGPDEGFVLVFSQKLAGKAF
jgi:hypothetical protein